MLSVNKARTEVMRQVLKTLHYLCNNGWKLDSIEYRRGQRSGQVEVSLSSLNHQPGLNRAVSFALICIRLLIA